MAKQPELDIKGFMAALWDNWETRDWSDIDSGDMHELALKHGLIHERPITADEAAEDWAAEWGLEEGDTSSFRTDAFKEYLA